MDAFYADNDTAIIGCYCVTDRHGTFFSSFIYSTHYVSNDEIYFVISLIIHNAHINKRNVCVGRDRLKRGIAKNVDSVIELLKIHQLVASGQ